jgi:hypothetical protein
MSNLIVLTLISSAFLMAGDPGNSQKSKNSDQGQASRMILNQPVVMGQEKTVGAAPNTAAFPAVADNDTIGNAKTVGGSRTYSDFDKDGVGKVGNSKTVGNQ